MDLGFMNLISAGTGVEWVFRQENLDERKKAFDSDGVEAVQARIPRLHDRHGSEPRYLMEGVAGKENRAEEWTEKNA